MSADVTARAIALRTAIRLAAATGSSLAGHIASGTGAVARTVQSRLRDRTSAFDFLTAAQIASVQARNEAEDVGTALQAAIDALWAAGGGTLYLPPGLYKITAPLKCRDKVHIVGAGRGVTHVKNALTPYNFTNSAVFQPGSFHPTYTQTFYGHANTHAINAAAAGANTVTLTTAGDAANYAVGDTVWVFTTSYYTSGGGQKIPEYAALAKVIGKASATLTLDRALSVAVTGSIHNVTTTSVNGADSTPLRAVADIRIADMTVETIGYWIADSACLRGQFGNLHVIARAAFYGNTHQLCSFSEVVGRVGIVAGELSHNSELTVVDGFALAFDTAIGTPTLGLTVQENGRNIAYRNGSLHLAGFTGSQTVLRWLNATRCTFDNIALYGVTGLTGAVIGYGDTAAAGRVPCTYNTARGIDWNGPCGRYVYNTGDTTTLGNTVEASNFIGTVSTNEALRIDTCTERNTVVDCFMEAGRLIFGSGVSDQRVVDCHIGGGVSHLTAGDETIWRANLIERIASDNSAARRGLNASETGSPSLTTSEVNFVDSAIGTDTLRLGDVIEVCLRVNVTGTTSTKTLTVKFHNGTTDVDLFDWIIAAGSTGTGWFKGTVAYVADNNIVCTGMAVIGGTASYFNSAVTSGIAGNALTWRISGQLGNAADTCQVREITSRLTNPVIA
jgi:hypothetical protein